MHGLSSKLHLIALCLLLLSGCGRDEAKVRAPVAVDVLTVKPTSIKEIRELPGRVEPVRSAEVHARVDGIIKAVMYQEGAAVKAGQILFEIDKREMRAKVNAAEAALQRAEATEKNARQEVSRYQDLVAKHTVSQQSYDNALARLRQASADVAESRAELEQARLTLDYASVKAPIDGRVGRALVREGALVRASESTMLTVVAQLDPVYVNIPESIKDVLVLRERISKGELSASSPEEVPITLKLENGQQYEHSGYFNYFDLNVAQTTGSISLRAQFPNPDFVLFPGLFVTAQIPFGELKNVIIIPQRAVIHRQSGAIAFTVDENNRIVEQPLTLGDLRGRGWIIRKGLKAEDRVVVNGTQKVRAGTTVNPQELAQTGEPTEETTTPQNSVQQPQKETGSTEQQGSNETKN